MNTINRYSASVKPLHLISILTVDISRILASLAIVGIVILQGCSPSPVLQSPRVKSAFSLGVTGLYEKTYSKIFIDTVVYRTGYNRTIYADHIKWDQNDSESTFPPINPCYLKWGIANRVEISGIALPLPFIWYYFINGNIKIFLQEHGSPRLFRNVSYAIFGGGNVVELERDRDKSAWVGAIVATRQIIGNTEIELILQPSYFQQRLNKWYDTPNEFGFIDGVQANFGTTFTAFRNRRRSLEVMLGGVYRHQLHNNWRIYDYSGIVLYRGTKVYDFSKWAFTGAVVINFNNKL